MFFEDLLANEKYLLHLFARALNEEAPRDIPADCSWEIVYDLSAQNGIQGLVWEAAKKLDSIPSGLKITWEKVASSILIRNVQLDAERTEIVRRLAENGVSYLALKGAALLPLYPSPSMRTMSDNDVLFGIVEADRDGGYRVLGSSDIERAASRDEAEHIVRDVMRDMGYVVSEHSGDVCDIQFSKSPYYRYEMHFSLMETHRPYYFYFANPWKRAVPVGEERAGKGREFRFSHEDQYVYMIVHAYKHENMGGGGIRILADIIVALRTAGERFDFSYVEGELSRMGLADYERTLRDLSLAVADERPLGDRLESLAAQMIACGKGSVERSVRAMIEGERAAGRWGRLGYLRKLCSPDFYCPGELEFIASNKLLRPLFPVGRFVLFVRNALRMPRRQLRKVLTFFKSA